MHTVNIYLAVNCQNTCSRSSPVGGNGELLTVMSSANPGEGERRRKKTETKSCFANFCISPLLLVLLFFLKYFFNSPTFFLKSPEQLLTSNRRQHSTWTLPRIVTCLLTTGTSTGKHNVYMFTHQWLYVSFRHGICWFNLEGNIVSTFK